MWCCCCGVVCCLLHRSTPLDLRGDWLIVSPHLHVEPPTYPTHVACGDLLSHRAVRHDARLRGVHPVSAHHACLRGDVLPHRHRPVSATKRHPSVIVIVILTSSLHSSRSVKFLYLEVFRGGGGGPATFATAVSRFYVLLFSCNGFSSFVRAYEHASSTRNMKHAAKKRAYKLCIC